MDQQREPYADFDCVSDSHADIYGNQDRHADFHKHSAASDFNIHIHQDRHADFHKYGTGCDFNFYPDIHIYADRHADFHRYSAGCDLNFHFHKDGHFDVYAQQDIYLYGNPEPDIYGNIDEHGDAVDYRYVDAGFRHCDGYADFNAHRDKHSEPDADGHGYIHRYADIYLYCNAERDKNIDSRKYVHKHAG